VVSRAFDDVGCGPVLAGAFEDVGCGASDGCSEMSIRPSSDMGELTHSQRDPSNPGTHYGCWALHLAAQGVHSLIRRHPEPANLAPITTPSSPE
jgi:hypothetical protein